jgi:hypothetical protein
MAAEIFVTILTGFGLGHLLKYGRELSAMDQVIGVMVVIVVIGLIADKILFSPWERFLHRRWVSPIPPIPRDVGASTVRRSIIWARTIGRLHVASGRKTRWYARNAERCSVCVGRPARS